MPLPTCQYVLENEQGVILTIFTGPPKVDFHKLWDDYKSSVASDMVKRRRKIWEYFPMFKTYIAQFGLTPSEYERFRIGE